MSSLLRKEKDTLLTVAGMETEVFMVDSSLGGARPWKEISEGDYVTRPLQLENESQKNL